MSIKKRDEILSNALNEGTPEEALKILKGAGMFTSIQCHGYGINNGNDNNLVRLKNKETKKTKKWWQFWK